MDGWNSTSSDWPLSTKVDADLDFRCAPISLKKSALPAERGVRRFDARTTARPVPRRAALGYAGWYQAAAAATGSPSLASSLRFWAVAASRNSSLAPLGPLRANADLLCARLPAGSSGPHASLKRTVARRIGADRRNESERKGETVCAEFAHEQSYHLELLDQSTRSITGAFAAVAAKADLPLCS